MKKIIALVLVLSMLMAFVPATLATNAFSASGTKQLSLQKNEMGVNKISSDVSSAFISDTKMRSELPKLSKNAMALNPANKAAGSWTDSMVYTLDMMEQSDSDSMGYYLPHTDDEDNAWRLANDFYQGSENWGVIFAPGEDNAIARFDEGESMFVNFDIIKSFDGNKVTYLNKDYQVAVYMFSGTYEQYDSPDSLSVTAQWSATNTANIKVTAPEDDYVYMFYIAITDPTVTQFGGWLTVSSFEKDYKDLTETEEIELGEEVEVEIGSGETTLFLDSYNVLTYGKTFEVELEAGKKYAALMECQEEKLIGGRMLLLDENNDVIYTSYIGAGAITGEISYEDCPLYIFPAVDGMYKVVLAGYNMNDVGKMTMVVDEQEKLGLTAFDKSKEVTIDVEELGEETVTDEDGHWEYNWLSSANLGLLVLAYPTDVFTLTGENENVVISMGNAVNVILDNATVGSIWLGNEWASVSIEAVGECSIVDTQVLPYAISNIEGCNSGLYITGEELEVEGTFGIFLENCPIHILCDECHVTAEGEEGSYTIATWVIGTLTPAITFSEKNELSDDAKLATLYFDANGYFQHGCAIASENYEELYRNSEDQNYSLIADEYTVTNDNEIITHTVTLVDGHTNTTIETLTVRHGKDVLFPKAPNHEADGVVFIGWDNEGKDITEDITITAKYIEKDKACVVTFVDGIDNKQISEINVEKGKAIEEHMFPEAPKHDGFVFDKWDYDGKEITEDITITAQYIKVEDQEHTVTFVDSINEETIEVQKVLHGKDAKMPVPPEHEGYTFKKWDHNGKNITKDITINAIYEEAAVVEHKVTFVDGYTKKTLETVLVKHGADVKLPVAPDHEAEGYAFVGWDKDGKNITEDTTITANYAEKDKVCVVTFVDGLDNKEIAKVNVEKGKDVVFPEPPVHAGYTFKEWDHDGKNITENITIIAKYEKSTSALELGDANGDGKVNTGDATYVLKYAVGNANLTEDQLVAADFNKDGKVNTGDAVGILKKLAAE